MPPGCKDLIDALNLAKSKSAPMSFRLPRVRVNEKIRAPEVRVVGIDGKQLGVMPVSKALALAKSQAADLVEVVPKATPPVCRIIDYGLFCYEQAKKSSRGN